MGTPLFVLLDDGLLNLFKNQVMDPILIILIGTSVVLFCITVLILHAVISLLLTPLVTGLLTTTDYIIDYATHSGFSEQDAHSPSNLLICKRLAIAFGNTSGKIGHFS